jgi:hypothetical protein
MVLTISMMTKTNNDADGVNTQPTRPWVCRRGGVVTVTMTAVVSDPILGEKND